MSNLPKKNIGMYNNIKKIYFENNVRLTLYPDGSEYWRKENPNGFTRHRKTGPAESFCDFNKNKVYLKWFKFGEIHRSDGPAEINLLENKKYWIFDNAGVREETYWNI